MKNDRCIMCLVLIVSGRKAEPSRQKCRCHMQWKLGLQICLIKSEWFLLIVAAQLHGSEYSYIKIWSNQVALLAEYLTSS